MGLSGIKSGQLPVFMENYHDSYAKAMAKYGLYSGIRGWARHTTTGQYYRELKRQTGELEANVRQLQTEQQQAEQQLVEARKEIMSEMLCRLKTEKDFDNKG